MTGGLENLPERVHAIEQKLDALSASVDERFDGVSAAIAEQRAYTEFAFEKLEARMDARFDQVDARFDQVDARFDRMEGRADKMDGQFARLDRKVDQILDLLLPKRSTDGPDGH